MKKYILLIVLMSSFVVGVWAQEDSDCSKNLKKAQRVYDSGEIEKVEAMIAECMLDGFNFAEKTEGYVLIILVNLFEDNIPQAEVNMVELLKHNPDFRPKSSDHQELKDLYAKFRTDPLLIIDYTVGLNFTEASVLKYHTLNYESPYFKEYSPRVGAAIGIVGNYLLRNNFRANLGASYKFQNYEVYEFYGYDGSSFDTDDHQLIDARVNTSLIGVQTGVTKEFGRRKLVPYAGLGGIFEIYTNSQHLIERSYVNSEASIGNVTGPSVNSLSLLNGYNLSALVDVGFRYKLGLKGKLIFSVKTSYGLVNQTFAASRYEDPELVYKYYFIPDDYLIHSMSVNIGYSQLIYNPKKLKNK